MALFIQFFTAFTHPADMSRWIAHHKGVVGDILGNHRSGADERIFPDGMAADDGAVGPKGGAFLDEGGADLVHLGDFRSGVVDICKDHGGPAEDAVFQGDAFVNAHIVLDFALVANDDIGTDDHVLTDVAVLAYFGAGEDVGKVPDLCAFADAHVVVNDGGGVDEDVRKVRVRVIGDSGDTIPISDEIGSCPRIV